MGCGRRAADHLDRPGRLRALRGDGWQDNGLVFAFKVGTELGSHNVRRSFRAVLKKADLNEKEWTPREMRHSFVSLLSDSGIPLENISRLVGHRNTSVTETVYRKQLRPMLLEGAEAMNKLFPDL
ncbi:tyrosine-type recombinase/integrase [Streptosporangium sp. NPDC004379]|uniref:tyrosine-type recombinase/integrase n=1 Tax=Streptosporangium sp. NPDC004379 TaxID=3366189 RepID=UPI0036738375